MSRFYQISSKFIGVEQLAIEENTFDGRKRRFYKEVDLLVMFNQFGLYVFNFLVDRITF